MRAQAIPHSRTIATVRPPDRGVVCRAVSGQHPTRGGSSSSSRRSARFPSATSAPSPASTPPTTSAWATSATPGRSAAPTHGARVRKGVTSRAARRRHRHRRRRPGCACARASSRGIEAFSQRQLYARGNLDLAVGFEGLFRLPNGRPPLLRIHDVHLPGRRVSTLTMGDGPRRPAPPRPRRRPRRSFFDTAAALSRTATASTRSTCPGFGSLVASPPRRPTTRALVRRAPSLGVMDALGIERAHLVGNSMGGRVAIEVGLRAPERVGGARRCCVPPWRSSSAAATRSCACCAPSSACCPTASAAAPVDAPVLGAVRRPRRRRPQRRRRRRRRVPAHLRLGRRPPRLPRARPATSTSTSPSARGGFYPRLADLEPPGAVRLGLARPR